MQVAYQLNSSELNINFIKSIKSLFENKKLSITVEDYQYTDNTEYLLSSENNRDRLLKSIQNIENKKDTLIYKNIDELLLIISCRFHY